MGYIHFPTQFTEEELMLQAKYQKLKKKKKALQALKAPEPEKPLASKRPADARDAREVARKLIKSGAIPAIQKQQTKQDQTSFKRPKGQERKRIQTDSSISSYQPFSSTQNDVQDTLSDMINDKEPNRIQNLYQQFAEIRDRDERGLNDRKGDTNRGEKPRVGNTIFVSGNKLTEEYLKKHFADFGTIVNVSMEIEKCRGFVTFSKPESSEKAISEMHQKNIGGIQLQVQLARRQPQINPINDASSSAVWATLAASQSQKGSHKDKREMVTYDEDFLMD
ncbi:negative elongation factor E [Condylostylus longicornis]|uniref:negative elongation factor E n=1 Tax=Condylostylus longicornis TaxID=2530218 RepID=UPI00244DBCC4|nr:negative elongation factor E [Condylostylus longicornis]